jgi:hypothetical protein
MYIAMCLQKVGKKDEAARCSKHLWPSACGPGCVCTGNINCRTGFAGSKWCEAHNTQPRSKGGLYGMCLVLAVQGNKQRHLMLRSRDLETEPHNGDCRTVLAEHSGTNTSNTLVREDAQNHRLRSHPGAGPSAIYHGRAELSRAGREETKWKCCCQLQNVSDLSTAPLLFCWKKQVTIGPALFSTRYESRGVFCWSLTWAARKSFASGHDGRFARPAKRRVSQGIFQIFQIFADWPMHIFATLSLDPNQPFIVWRCGMTTSTFPRSAVGPGVRQFGRADVDALKETYCWKKPIVSYCRSAFRIRGRSEPYASQVCSGIVEIQQLPSTSPKIQKEAWYVKGLPPNSERNHRIWGQILHDPTIRRYP